MTKSKISYLRIVTIKDTNDSSGDNVDNLNGKVWQGYSQQWALTMKIHFEDGTFEEEILPKFLVGWKLPKSQVTLWISCDDTLKKSEMCETKD